VLFKQHERGVRVPARIKIVGVVASHTGELLDMGMPISDNGRVVYICGPDCDGKHAQQAEEAIPKSKDVRRRKRRRKRRRRRRSEEEEKEEDEEEEEEEEEETWSGSPLLQYESI
jgi:hypothetical protein